MNFYLSAVDDTASARSRAFAAAYSDAAFVQEVVAQIPRGQKMLGSLPVYF
ncbi:MAG: hypothetical protein ACREQW_19095 [Candidatus Binatia bacterium]